MFKRGSPFQIPTIPGGRKILKQDQSQLKTSSSVSKIVQQKNQNMQYRGDKNAYLQSSKIQVNSPSVVDQRFCFQLDVPSTTDSTLYWMYQLGNQVSGEYSRRLIFRQMHFVSRSLAQSQAAQTIYILADQIQGYKNKQGVITQRVCALHLCQTQATIDDTQTKVYDLLYKQTQDVAWDIPLNLTAVKFRVQFDDQPVRSGLLNIPLTCQFDIRHSGK